MTGWLSATILALSGIVPPDGDPCINEAHDLQPAYNSMSELPAEVQRELRSFLPSNVADADEPIQSTDMDISRDNPMPWMGFQRAYTTRHLIFISFRRRQMPPLIITFYRTHSGVFSVERNLFLAGPTCLAINAALDGVYNPGILPELQP